jgi:hypothetical protein
MKASFFFCCNNHTRTMSQINSFVDLSTQFAIAYLDDHYTERVVSPLNIIFGNSSLVKCSDEGGDNPEQKVSGCNIVGNAKWFSTIYTKFFELTGEYHLQIVLDTKITMTAVIATNFKVVKSVVIPKTTVRKWIEECQTTVAYMVDAYLHDNVTLVPISLQLKKVGKHVIIEKIKVLIPTDETTKLYQIMVKSVHQHRGHLTQALYDARNLSF